MSDRQNLWVRVDFMSLTIALIKVIVFGKAKHPFYENILHGGL